MAGADPVQAQIDEAELEHSFGRFRGISVVPKRLADPIAKFGFVELPVRQYRHIRPIQRLPLPLMTRLVERDSIAFAILYFGDEPMLTD